MNGDYREHQEYLKIRAIDKDRMVFRIRTRMVDKVKMNFKNMYKDNLKCEKCDSEEDETQKHVLVCPGWTE